MDEGIVPERLFENLLTEDGQEVYAILDGASVPGLLDRLESDTKLEFECLFPGELEPDMEEVAPYLVKLDLESDFADWVVGTGWGQHWGCYVTSREDFYELRNHLSDLTTVYQADGTPLFFRYYDPRVLRIFLPTCQPEQLKKMFGPVDAFVAESDTESSARIYRLNGDILSTMERRIA